jgi:hypothetical protein
MRDWTRIQAGRQGNDGEVACDVRPTLKQHLPPPRFPRRANSDTPAHSSPCMWGPCRWCHPSMSSCSAPSCSRGGSSRAVAARHTAPPPDPPAVGHAGRVVAAPHEAWACSPDAGKNDDMYAIYGRRSKRKEDRHLHMHTPTQARTCPCPRNEPTQRDPAISPISKCRSTQNMQKVPCSPKNALCRAW